MRRIRCDECRFWDHEMMECHRRAPTFTFEKWGTRWPGTTPSDFCGEAEAKPRPARKAGPKPWEALGISRRAYFYRKKDGKL